MVVHEPILRFRPRSVKYISSFERFDNAERRIENLTAILQPLDWGSLSLCSGRPVQEAVVDLELDTHCRAVEQFNLRRIGNTRGLLGALRYAGSTPEGIDHLRVYFVWPGSRMVSSMCHASCRQILFTAHIGSGVKLLPDQHVPLTQIRIECDVGTDG